MAGRRARSGVLTTAAVVGIRANLARFSLLVAVNAFVGAMVGIERAALPLLAEHAFGITSASIALSFIIAFGVTKAFANLTAGRLADRLGRRPMLIAGWMAALPVAPMIMWAPRWGWVVAANVLLGVNQGLAWSATVIMKIDLAGPRQRGLAMGINEVAGYGAVAVAAYASASLAAAHGPRPAPYVLGVVISLAGMGLSLGVRETRTPSEDRGSDGAEPTFREVFVRVSARDRTLSAVSQAGLVNNLNDGMAWGLLPIYLASRGLGVGRIAIVASLYPAVWGITQLATGALSDRIGRKGPIVTGLWVQAASIAWFVTADGFAAWTAAAAAMGAGTALVYPTLLAAVGDASQPSWRATALGVYRLWRDLGFAVGALVSGVVADAFGHAAAIWVVAVVTACSGVVVAARMSETLER